MLRVEILSSSTSIHVATTEFLAGVWRQNLVTAEKIPRSPLSLPPLEVRGLIRKVQNEPQLDARIGDRDRDAVGCRLLESALEVWMFITIKDAPNLVVCLAFTSALLSRFAALGFDRAINELERSSMKGIDGDDRGVSELAAPIDEVTVLRTFALGENQELTSADRASRAAGRAGRRPRCQCSPAVIISAAAANS